MSNFGHGEWPLSENTNLPCYIGSMWMIIVVPGWAWGWKRILFLLSSFNLGKFCYANKKRVIAIFYMQGGHWNKGSCVGCQNDRKLLFSLLLLAIGNMQMFMSLRCTINIHHFVDQLHKIFYGSYMVHTSTVLFASCKFLKTSTSWNS